MNYILTLTLALAACFGLQTLALHLVGGRTTKSESNFFSSIARIQTGAAEPLAEVFLAGSSLTGRFPSRTEEFPEVANMGCDGGSAAVVMRAIDKGILPLPPILVIEGNTLYREQGGGKSLVAEVMDSPWFGVGRKVTNLGATARPSAFAYSILLERKVGRADEGEKLPLPVPAIAMIPPPGLEPLPEKAASVVAELAAITARFRERGCRMLIVQLPPGAAPEKMNTRMPYELSRVTGIPLLDLSKDLPPGSVRYTDGIHMAPASAAAALRSILAALDKM
ncbi:MAG: hypothetical protein RLZZ505_2969 [Verrucomicrobiota bacterium]|jgi:hypothetical protein